MPGLEGFGFRILMRIKIWFYCIQGKSQMVDKIEARLYIGLLMVG